MPAPAPRLLPAFAAAGLAATSAQVLLLRDLLVSAAGDEAAIGAGYAAWFLGIALGAAAWRRFLCMAFPTNPPIHTKFMIAHTKMEFGLTGCMVPVLVVVERLLT